MAAVVIRGHTAAPPMEAAIRVFIRALRVEVAVADTAAVPRVGAAPEHGEAGVNS